MTVREQLQQLKACREAVGWASQFGTLEEAWAACERGDWMLWLAGCYAGPALGDGRKPLVLAACACARLSLKHVKPDEDCALRAIELAERWARGEDSPSSPGSPITHEELWRVTSASYTSASASAYAASYTAASAFAASYTAASAFAASYTAAATAAFAATAAARKETLRQCADIVRTYYPTPPAPQQEKHTTNPEGGSREI